MSRHREYVLSAAMKLPRVKTMAAHNFQSPQMEKKSLIQKLKVFIASTSRGKGIIS